MALAQQKFREIVFQLLYSFEVGRPDEASMIDMIMTELAVSKRNVRLAQERVNKILERLPEIDPMISSASTSYDFDRIQTVAKNILRLGVFELFFDEDIPPKVVIAEAIRLSRKFGTPESASFVNAILDNLYQLSLGTTVNQQALDQIAQELAQSEQLAEQAAQEAALNPKDDDDQDELEQED